MPATLLLLLLLLLRLLSNPPVIRLHLMNWHATLTNHVALLRGFANIGDHP